MNEPIFRLNEKIIDAGNMGGNLTSVTLDVSEIRQMGIQEIYSGSPTGSLVIQSSNDGSNWFTEDTNSISSSGNKMVKLTNIGYKYIRATYTASGGSGSLTIYAAGKI